MTRTGKIFKSLLFVLLHSVASPIWAQSDGDGARLEALFAQLQDPDLENWQTVEEEIWRHWSRSGSASMDLLLQRGREAMEEGDYWAAIEHLSALTDHAPGFAEGWNARATAYYQMEKFGLSLADIERTLALNPRHFGALTGLGSIFEQTDQPRRALEVYRIARSIHPHAPHIEVAIERLERDLGDIDL